MEHVEILLTALRSIAQSYPTTDEGECMQSEAQDALRAYERATRTTQPADGEADQPTT